MTDTPTTGHPDQDDTPDAQEAGTGTARTIHVLVENGEFLAAHATEASAAAARQRVIDAVRSVRRELNWRQVEPLDEDAIEIVAVELQGWTPSAGPERPHGSERDEHQEGSTSETEVDVEARNRELDRTRTLEVANARLTNIHASDECFRPNGHCWIHDPSPANMHPLRAAPVYVLGANQIYRACSHYGPTGRDHKAMAGLHPDPDWLAFERFNDEGFPAPAHGCCVAFCCLPEPPTATDRTLARTRIYAINRQVASIGAENISAHHERRILQDTVLERLAQQRQES